MKYAIFWLVALSIVLAIATASYKRKYESLRHQYNKLEVSYLSLQDDYKKLYHSYTSLLDKVKVDEERYRESINRLLKLANKSPKRIEVPVVVTKEIVITDEDCKRLGIMIDQAIQMIQQEGR